VDALVDRFDRADLCDARRAGAHEHFVVDVELAYGSLPISMKSMGRVYDAD
jgi:hypothetical protein